MGNGSDFEHNMLVAWAAGTVVAQVGCTLDQAVELMAARAEETHRTLDEIAVDTAERRMRFDATPRARRAS